MMFASRENSCAEQRAILNEIVTTFDAVEVGVPPDAASSPGMASGGRGNPNLSGLERARQLAAQATDYRETDQPDQPDEPARPNWDQSMLWEEAS